MAKSIFITGAGAGIGREVANLFASEGWLVCATDIDQNSLNALENKLGPKHCYCQVDVTDTGSIERALETFSSETGGHIDVLLNNAGILFIEKFENLSLEQNNAVTNVNISGVLNMTYLTKPYLDKSESPMVINMCSASSNYGVPNLASYSASKFWIKGFTEALNIEWEEQGIHVCDVMPNFVATPMTDNCEGEIMENVGVKLTAKDVAKAVWKAAHNRNKVHWYVDSFIYHLSRISGKFLPQSILRAFVKRMAGY
jgi:short-subunit dehydrogenase